MVTVWNIFYEYFVYKPSYPDENHKYFHIVNLKKKSTILLEDTFKSKDF